MITTSKPNLQPALLIRMVAQFESTPVIAVLHSPPQPRQQSKLHLTSWFIDRLVWVVQRSVNMGSCYYRNAALTAGHHRQLSGNSISKFSDRSAVIHGGPHRKTMLKNRVYVCKRTDEFLTIP